MHRPVEIREQMRGDGLGSRVALVGQYMAVVGSGGIVRSKLIF